MARTVPESMVLEWVLLEVSVTCWFRNVWSLRLVYRFFISEVYTYLSYLSGSLMELHTRSHQFLRTGILFLCSLWASVTQCLHSVECTRWLQDTHNCLNHGNFWKPHLTAFNVSSLFKLTTHWNYHLVWSRWLSGPLQDVGSMALTSHRNSLSSHIFNVLLLQLLVPCTVIVKFAEGSTAN